MFRFAVFIILSLGLVIWSRKSLRNRQSHGFYRFFSFESLLALILINAKSWFMVPFSVTQIISWILLVGSVTMASSGFYLLHKIGKPEKGIEETTILVKRGIYRYVRHPLYSSLVMLGWGAFLKDISLLSAVLAILATGFSVATAMVEEKENRKRFGEEYLSYMKSARRFLPFLV